MTINITDSKLTASPTIIGDGNSININSSVSNIDWEMLQDEFIEVLGKLPKSSKEYSASKEALDCAMRKDDSKFINVLKKNSASFLSNIFTGVASGALVEIIKHMIQ